MPRMNLHPLSLKEAPIAENIIGASLEGLDIPLTAHEKEDLHRLPFSFTDRGGLFFLLEIQESAVGTVGIRPLSPSSGIWEIAWLCLLPGWRGMGIGRMMAETAIAAARERGALAIVAQWDRRCDAAIALLERLSFRRENSFEQEKGERIRLRLDFASS